MRVLHCVGCMNMAGIETFIMNVYRAINRNEVQFDFLCDEQTLGDYDAEITNMQGKIYYLPSESNIAKGPLRYLDIMRRNFSFFHKNKDFDAVHIHNHHCFDILLKAIPCRILFSGKIYVHSHNTWAPHPKLNKLASVVLNKMNVQRLACGIEAGKWLYGKADYTVINNGIDVDKFKFNEAKRSAFRKEMGLLDKDRVLLHVGRFETQKNHIFLIELFDYIYQKDNNVFLYLVGEGTERRNIEKRVEQKSCRNNIVFLGRRNDVDKILCGSDLFILPSLYEGLPVVGVEAQTNGIPCVFSDTITDEIQINCNCKYISLDEGKSEWYSHILDLLSEKNDRKIGYTNILNSGYSIKDVAKKLEKMYVAIK